MNKFFMIFFVPAFIMTTGISGAMRPENEQDKGNKLVPALMYTIRKADCARFQGLYGNVKNNLPYAEKKQLFDLADKRWQAAQMEKNFNRGAIHKDKMIRGACFLGMGLATGYFVYKGISPNFLNRHNAALDNSFASVLQSTYTTAKVCCKLAAITGTSLLCTNGLFDLCEGYNYQNRLDGNYKKFGKIRQMLEEDTRTVR